MSEQRSELSFKDLICQQILSWFFFRLTIHFAFNLIHAFVKMCLAFNIKVKERSCKQPYLVDSYEMEWNKYTVHI